MFAGWLRVRSSSRTVTVKDTDTGLFRSSGSDAEQVTMVCPIGKMDPEDGLHVAAGGVVSSGSLTVGAKETVAPLGLVALAVTGADGALMARSSSG
jgi:hypothetical protein